MSTSPDAPQPEPLTAWQEHGFSVADARRWIGNGFMIGEAEAWRRSGVYRATEALEWRSTGGSPHNVHRWLSAGMTPAEAVRWREFGYSPEGAVDRHLAGERPRIRNRWWRRRTTTVTTTRDEQIPENSLATLRALRAARVPPAVARRYSESGWAPEPAVDWATSGVDALEARVLVAMGFAPKEGTRVLGDGDALDLMATWWGAGVPLSEMATWCAAGFTPEQAKEAIAGEASSAQAEILRALTEGE